MNSQLEIERKFLLDRLPAIPKDAQVQKIEQGYLPDHKGRLRKTVLADGSVVFHHTIKTGSGMIRNETQRKLSLEEFQQLWPQTQGRRIRKIRYLLSDEHGGEWAIDQFEGMDLVLAEIELPSADTPYLTPPWLSPHIVRDVTDDPSYTNAAIACRA